jgi:hypothetical protein
MKSFKYIYIVFSLTFWSCMDNSIYIEPVADFEILQGETVELYQPVSFKISGSGNRMTLYTGDVGKNFDNRDIGVVLKSGDVYQYSYTTVGTYEVVLLVTSFNEMGENLETEMKRKTIRVTTGPNYKGIIQKVNYTYEGASIKCYADIVSGLKSDYVLTDRQLVSYADVVESNGSFNCVIYTNYYNRMWEDTNFFGTIIPNANKSKIGIRTENEFSGIKVFYYMDNLKRDTIINIERAQSFIFSKASGSAYKPVILKSYLGANTDTVYYNIYTLPYPEMKSFTISNVKKEGNTQIRMKPTGIDRFYSIFKIQQNTSLVPAFTTYLSPNVVVTDKTGKVIKGDGTDEPMNFFDTEPVTFTLTYTDPDFPTGFNKSVSYFTVFVE